jgi:hypothetical protein
MRSTLLRWAQCYHYPRLITVYGAITSGYRAWLAFVCLASDVLIVAAWQRIGQWYRLMETTR